jgi:uncharacterized protein
MAEIIATLKRYNFWDAPVPESGYPRDGYLENIAGYCGNRLIKVLVGQRRTGKSYLMRQLIRRFTLEGVPACNILYINKEYTDFDFLEDYHALLSLIGTYRSHCKPTGKIYLMLDEVQGISGWEHAVNSLSQDHTRDVEIFITGSNANLLSVELATLLSGRYVQFMVFPFSFSEYCGMNQVPEERSRFLEYLKTGGMPELFRLPGDETRRHYLTALKDTILLHDVVARYQVKDIRLLEDIFAFLVNNISNLTSISSLIRYFESKSRKTNYETIANYIGHLTSSLLFHQADRFSIKGKEIVSGSAKYYLNDLSYKNYLYPAFDHGYGYQLENLVYLSLRRMGYEVMVGNMRNREIDFVAIHGDRTVYLQVAWSIQDDATRAREYGELAAIPDHYEKYVVTADDITYPNQGGIRHLQAWEIIVNG